jgi:hypothetical protein
MDKSFTEQTGQSPNKFVMTLRIEHAAGLHARSGLALENQITMSQNRRIGSWRTTCRAAGQSGTTGERGCGALRSLIQPES